MASGQNVQMPGYVTYPTAYVTCQRQNRFPDIFDAALAGGLIVRVVEKQPQAAAD
jgi:hypothetical protein